MSSRPPGDVSRAVVAGQTIDDYYRERAARGHGPARGAHRRRWLVPTVHHFSTRRLAPSWLRRHGRWAATRTDGRARLGSPTAAPIGFGDERRSNARVPVLVK